MDSSTKEDKELAAAEKYRAYQREYKKKKYYEDVQTSRVKSHINYLKRTGQLSTDDIKKYGLHSADARATINLLKSLKEKGEFAMIKDILGEAVGAVEIQ